MKRTMLIAVVVMGLVFGLVAYATAGATSSAADVSANVKEKISISINDAALAFGDVDPGVPNFGVASITVSSNKAFTISNDGESSYTYTGTGSASATFAAALGLTRTGLAAGGSKGVTVLSETYSYNVPWATDPGTHAAQFTYTATQS